MAFPRPIKRRRWDFKPEGEWRRRVSPDAALNSPVVSQGAAAVSVGVRRVGVAASLSTEASMAKTVRSGEAMSAGDWGWSLMFTCSG